MPLFKLCFDLTAWASVECACDLKHWAFSFKMTAVVGVFASHMHVCGNLGKRLIQSEDS